MPNPIYAPMNNMGAGQPMYAPMGAGGQGQPIMTANPEESLMRRRMRLGMGNMMNQGQQGMMGQPQPIRSMMGAGRTRQAPLYGGGPGGPTMTNTFTGSQGLNQGAPRMAETTAQVMGVQGLPRYNSNSIIGRMRNRY